MRGNGLKEERREIAASIDFLETTGILLLSMIYDADDKVFADIVMHGQYGERVVEYYQRGSPSTTHRVVDIATLHPQIDPDGTLRELDISFVPFLPFLTTESFGDTYLRVYEREGAIHFGHTMSFYACDTVLWQSSVSKLTERGLDSFLEKWREHLTRTNLAREKRIYEYWDCIPRVISYCAVCLKNERWKKIVRRHLDRIVEEFLNLVKEGSDIHAGFPNGSSAYFDPYILDTIGQIESLEGINDGDSILTETCSNLRKSITKNLDDRGILIEEGKEEFEGTIAFLCGLALLAKHEGEELQRELKERVREVVRFLKSVEGEDGIYDICKLSLTYRIHRDEIQTLGEVIFIPSSFPCYLLRLAITLRELYGLENLSCRLGKEAVSLCKMRKGG